jgi:hypothetical protein
LGLRGIGYQDWRIAGTARSHTSSNRAAGGGFCRFDDFED